MTVCDTHKFCT